VSCSSLIQIGTSGSHYKHWKGPFYPKNMKPQDFLSYYAKRFGTSEINNSFYKLPEDKILISWRDIVPTEFCFAVKAGRFITHMKKLKDPEESTDRFLNRIELLKDKLGPVLFQLPPKWKCNLERLEAFLGTLPPNRQYSIEFRDLSWLIDEVYELLQRYNIALCIYDMDQWVSPKVITADFIYVRLHGPEAKYEGAYDVHTLSGWARAFSSWAAQGKQVYCYFDNDEQGFAALDALRLKEMLKNVGI
jgi:uncharacterized protein YecE (DUF72 family)